MPANGFADTNLDPVKEDELKTDWGIDPLTPEQITQFGNESYAADTVVQPNPRHELVELANTLAD